MGTVCLGATPFDSSTIGQYTPTATSPSAKFISLSVIETGVAAPVSFIVWPGTIVNEPGTLNVAEVFVFVCVVCVCIGAGFEVVVFVGNVSTLSKLSEAICVGACCCTT